MSMSRYLPPIGTAGFDRMWVRGKSRVPWPAAEDDDEDVAHGLPTVGHLRAGQMQADERCDAGCGALDVTPARA